MLLSQAIEGYILDRLAGGYSPATMDIHKVFLSRLDGYLQSPVLNKITPADLNRFMVWLQSEYVPNRMSGDTSPLAPASIDGAWRAIRSFYKWAAEALQINRPDAGLKRPRYKPAQVSALSQADIKAILRATEGRQYTRRNKAIILLMLDTGLRVGETCRLTVQDINNETGEILVVPYRSGLKSRPRSVWIGKAARRALWLYRAGDPKKARDSLFDMTPIAIRLMLRRAGIAAKVADVHPHRLRHTFAIVYLRNGGDVFTLQRLLGHSDLSMVRHYLDLAQADDENAHRKASPVDNWRL
jgi:integrase/recombinase XerD